MSSQIFRNLHHGPGLLLLPNAWDAITARVIESLGAKAIATTSAGLAWSRGYPDGNALPEDLLIAATRDIARVIRVPLTVDIEGGYSDDPGAVAPRKSPPSEITMRIRVPTCSSTRARMFAFVALHAEKRPRRKSYAGPRSTVQQVVTVCLCPVFHPPTRWRQSLRRLRRCPSILWPFRICRRWIRCKRAAFDA